MKVIYAIGFSLSILCMDAAATQASCSGIDFTNSNNVVSPRFEVDQQGLTPGDTMTATFTYKVGAAGAEVERFIVDPVSGNKVTCSATVAAGSTSIFFGIFGFLNGHTIGDLHQTHSNSGFNGTLELAAFVPSPSGVLQEVGLANWLLLNSMSNSTALSIPDFITVGMDLFYGVDLAVWSVRGFNVDASQFGTDFSIINGESPLLPGFTFSTDPLVNGNNGWETSTPFSGTAKLDSLHALKVKISEPNTSLLVGLAIAALVSRSGKRISRSCKICLATLKHHSRRARRIPSRLVS